MKVRLLASLCALLIAIPATSAMADVISEEESVCRSREEGDACTISGRKGACAKSTCSRNDYSNGPPPTIKQVECLVCDPEAKPADDAKSEKSGACTVTMLSEPLPLSLASLAVGAGLLVALGRRRRRSEDHDA